VPWEEEKVMSDEEFYTDEELAPMEGVATVMDHFMTEARHWKAKHDEAAAHITALTAEVERLREALTFYADKTRYHGPNQPNVTPDEFGPLNFPFRWDVTRDNGDMAAQALEPKP
jgi:hypothetical protein